MRLVQIKGLEAQNWELQNVINMANSLKGEEQNGARFNKIFDFDFKIKKDMIPKFLPFFFFISVMLLLYIANKYYAEKSYLEETLLKNELKELRAESLTTKAELVNKTKESEVAKLVENVGLEENKEPPKKIVVEKGEY